MIKNIKNRYKDVRVILDNNEFIGCTFEGCTMEYSGTGAVSLVECSFTNVSWVFSGGAEKTLVFLNALYHGMGEGGRKLVESTFDNIRNAKLTDVKK
jgi:hypothetical protein